MNINDAIDLLEFAVRQDRIIRNYDIDTEYQELCERNCGATEIVINALRTCQKALREQDNFIHELFNDPSFSDALKGEYAEKYNKLNIKVDTFL